MSWGDALRLCIALAGAFLCIHIAPPGHAVSYGIAGFIGAGVIAILVN